MDQPSVVVLLTLAATALVVLLVLLILGRGSLARLGPATQAFAHVLRDAAAAARVASALHPPPPKPPRPSGEPLRLLTLLQREGRLLDFVLEDVTQASDEQIGAGVRELHPKWQTAVKEHLVLEPVLAGEEGTPVEVPTGFDPSAIRLTGNVTGQPPFRGTLYHHGWRVKDYKLDAPPQGQDEFIIQPAQVELP
jgi:hypothetical protein